MLNYNDGAMISGGLNPETSIEILPLPVFIFLGWLSMFLFRIEINNHICGK